MNDERRRALVVRVNTDALIERAGLAKEPAIPRQHHRGEAGTEQESDHHVQCACHRP